MRPHIGERGDPSSTFYNKTNVKKFNCTSNAHSGSERILWGCATRDCGAVVKRGKFNGHAELLPPPSALHRVRMRGSMRPN